MNETAQLELCCSCTGIIGMWFQKLTDGRTDVGAIAL